MRLVVQRVTEANVKVDGKIVGEIKKGFLVLLGIKTTDTKQDVDYLVRKLINLRVFSDENDKMNLALKDIGGELLIISQFTLYGDCKKGSRPSYIKALNGDKASPLYDKFNEELSRYVKVSTGVFGSDMEISFTNIGPVTIIIEK